MYFSQHGRMKRDMFERIKYPTKSASISNPVNILVISTALSDSPTYLFSLKDENQNLFLLSTTTKNPTIPKTPPGKEKEYASTPSLNIHSQELVPTYKK